MACEITNDRDIIDSREVTERITELENLADSDGVYVLDEDETAELAALQALAEEGKDEAAEWKDGAALIRESYWTDYARQLAEDIGAINREAADDWPLSHISTGKRRPKSCRWITTPSTLTALPTTCAPDRWLLLPVSGDTGRRGEREQT